MGILNDLPLLSWRGIVVPCVAAPYRFSHSQAERRFPYVNGAAHDWTGLDPIEFTATLHVHNGIKGGPWYPTKWIPLREALLDGTVGSLIHPDLGRVRAVVKSGSVDLKSENRGGVEVEVTWSSTVEDPTADVLFQGFDESPKALAEAVDAGMLTLGIEMPDGSAFSSLTNAIAQIDGAILSATLTATGTINQALGLVNDLIERVEGANDSANWSLVSNLKALFVNLRRLAAKAETLVQRDTGKLTVQNDTSIDALAADTGNTTTEIAGLNLALLRSPIVPKGAVVTFYR